MCCDLFGLESKLFRSALDAPETKIFFFQVSDLITELTRITVLWDEQWIHGLSHLFAGEFSSRHRLLKEEASRLQNNTTLSSEDKTRLLGEMYIAIMKPLLMKLKSLYPFLSK